MESFADNGTYIYTHNCTKAEFDGNEFTKRYNNTTKLLRTSTLYPTVLTLLGGTNPATEQSEH